MSNLLKSPWAAVTLAIVVMTVGYTMHLKTTGALASDSLYQCPAEELCKKVGCHGEGDCNKEECASCPFCLQHAS